MDKRNVTGFYAISIARPYIYPVTKRRSLYSLYTFVVHVYEEMGSDAEGKFVEQSAQDPPDHKTNNNP